MYVDYHGDMMSCVMKYHLYIRSCVLCELISYDLNILKLDSGTCLKHVQ